MRTLVAGPWYGSLHGELLCWQGWLRAQSRKYNKTYVIASLDKKAIYQDFATAVIPPEAAPHLPGADVVTQRDVPVQWIGHQPWVKDQEFKVVGRMPEDHRFQILADAQDSGHFSRKQWGEIIYDVPDNLDVAWVSDGLTKCHAIGGTDLRQAGFDQILQAVLSARVVIGPSSGIAALASICAVPYITWVKHGSPNLYGSHWNPHNTPGTAFLGQPSTEQVRAAVQRLLRLYDPEYYEEEAEVG